MAITDIRKLKDILELEITNSSNVFIVGHNNPDFDAIGSSIGLACLSNYYGKDSYIIVEETANTLQPSVKKMIDMYKKDYHFIKKKDISKLIDDNSILLVTDVNKSDMISVGNRLNDFKSIIILDHHSGNDNTIDTDYIFINSNVSSASEIVARILIALKAKYSDKVANALLAGIELDTKRFQYNDFPSTYDTAEKLIKNGAKAEEVRSWFLEDFDSYCRISNLIINGTVIKEYGKSLIAPINASFTLNRNNPKTIYHSEDCAKAAVQMISFKGVDAAFALGYINETEIYISARGNSKVDVAKIMDKLGGGGNPQCAAAKLESEDIFDVEKALMRRIKYGLTPDVEISNNPKVIKEKRIKR